MINDLLPLLLLLLPLETLSGKDDVVIVEPAAMIVKPSADGKWQMVRPSSITTQSREPRRGEVELDLFQVETDKGRNEEEEPSRISSVQLELFRVEKKKDNPKEQERGAVELSLFGDGSSREKNNERDSKAYALISQNPSGNWVQKGSSENKVRCFVLLFLPLRLISPPFQVLPFKLNLLGVESKVSSNISILKSLQLKTGRSDTREKPEGGERNNREEWGRGLFGGRVCKDHGGQEQGSQEAEGAEGGEGAAQFRFRSGSG